MMGEGPYASHSSAEISLRQQQGQMQVTQPDPPTAKSCLVLLAKSELTPSLAHDSHISKDLFVN